MLLIIASVSAINLSSMVDPTPPPTTNGSADDSTPPPTANGSADGSTPSTTPSGSADDLPPPPTPSGTVDGSTPPPTPDEPHHSVPDATTAKPDPKKCTPAVVVS